MSEAADELAAILASAQDWARRNLGPQDGHFGPAESCQWCPLCQLMAAVRGDRPELATALADLGPIVVSTLRGFFDAVSRPSSAGPASGPADGPADGPVEHIDLGGE